MKTTKYLKRVSPIHACLPRQPLMDGSELVAIQQHRQRWQCRPVCKLYVKPSSNTTGRKCRNFSLVKVLVNEHGMSIEEAIEYAKNL